MIRKLVYNTIRFVLRKRIQRLEKKKELYAEYGDDHEKIYDYQLNKLNEVWENAYTNIPFYKKWKEKHNLPDEIKSIKELETFPILTKQDIYKNQEFILKNLDNYYLTSTGGTSGITTHFPTSKKDADEAYINAYLGRSWWGIEPLDTILMFWGHSHLFGKGFKRYFKQFKKKLSDILINTTKVSSYALNANNVKIFFDKILEVEPKTIISYSSNIYKICKYIETTETAKIPKNLQCVILTSETVSDVDIDLVEKNLKVPVVNEYGMAETGAIAYSFKETNNIKVFWDSVILTINKDKVLHITTISDKIFPLFNYTSEDIAEVKESYKLSIFLLSKVIGKQRNVLSLPFKDKSIQKISTIFFDHVMKFYRNIYSIHYKQKEHGIEILLTSNIKLDLKDVKFYMNNEIAKEFSEMDTNAIQLIQIDNEHKTIAGKNKVLLKT